MMLPPRGVNLKALDRRLNTIWRSRRGSARNMPGVRRAIQLQGQAHLGGPFAGMGGDIGQQVVEIDALQLQPQRAGFHQRQVENVVDQALERVGARDDGLDIFVLAGR